MSVLLNINGNDYPYPEPLDLNWGQDATDWAIAVTNGMLQKAGGLFQLLGEVDFGTSYGLKSLYYKSRGTNPATTGVVRLANAESIVWRNQANNADLALTVNSSNELLFNGSPIGAVGSISDTNSIDLTLATGVLSADLKLSNDSPASGYINAALTVETDGLHAEVPIMVGDSGSGGSSGVVPAPGIGDAANFLRGDGTWQPSSSPLVFDDTTTINLTDTSGTVTADIVSDSITNSLISNSASIAYSKLNLSGAILNADINASAAIAYSKLAALTASRALVSDVSGFISASSTTSTQISYLSTLTSDAQAQIDTKQTRSVLTTKGDIYAATASDTVTRVAVGTDGTFLKADSSAGAGLSYGSPTVILPFRSVTSTDTATTSDSTLYLSGASFTETLFTAVGNTGHVLTIVHNGTSLSQVYTLATTSGQTIGGIASGSYSLYTNGESLRIQSDGANWVILDHRTSTPYVSYTPTTNGIGTPSAVNVTWYRSGLNICGSGVLTTGPVTSSEFRIGLPGSLTTPAGLPTLSCAGELLRNNSGVNTVKNFFLLKEPSTSYVTFSYAQYTIGSSPLTKLNGNQFNNSELLAFQFSVPIAGFQP